MTLTITLVTVVTLASLASSVSTTPTTTQEPDDGKTPRDDYTPSESKTELPDSYQPYPEIPLSFELPRIDYNPIPFNVPEPYPYLTAPRLSQEPNHYMVKLPSEDLVPPTETSWNPNHDPKLYYEVPAFLTRQVLPTYEFPKKFNKDVHSKDKPFSWRPKQEIVLDPIDEKEYEAKQKEMHKVFEQVAKKSNQKQIDAEKQEQAVQV